jgi:hypothetical protein
MGQLFAFRCDACGYKAEVSGGPDVGMAVATQTVSCAACKRLFDAVTSEDPGNDTAPKVPLRCPRSRGAKHRVSAWNGGDPCPRCLGPMRVTDDGTVLWD